MELAEAAQDAWDVLAVVFHDGGSRSGRAADSARIAEILDSPDRAPLLKRNLDAVLAESGKRDALQHSLEEALDTSRELISRWAVVLTGSSNYSELFDRHVEMIGRIHGLWYFLANGVRRGSQFREPGGAHRHDWFVDNFLAGEVVCGAGLVRHEERGAIRAVGDGGTSGTICRRRGYPDVET